MVVAIGATAAVPITAAESASMSSFSPELQAIMLSLGIFRFTGCISNPNGVVMMLVANGCINAMDVLYVDARIGQHVDTVSFPTADNAVGFLDSDAGVSFTWTHQSDAALLASDKNRVAGRILLLFRECLALARRPNTDDVDDDRLGLLSSQSESCTAANVRCYGYCIPPSGLPVLSVLGRMYKTFASGSTNVFTLEKMIAQNEQAGRETFLFDVATSSFAKKKNNAKIASISDFLFRLSIRGNGLAYVGCVFVVEPAVWTGCLELSKVTTGSHVQFTRRDADRYVEAWRPYLQKFEGHADAAARFDYRIQRLIPDLFSSKLRFGHAQMEAFNIMRGEIATFVPRQRDPFKAGGKHPRPPANPAAGPASGVSSSFDIAKKAKTFDPNRRTGSKNENGEQLCKHYNDRRDGKECSFGQNCKFKHQCDVIVDGKVCGSDQHHRLTHP